MASDILLTLLVTTATAQQVYIQGQGPVPRPSTCTTSTPNYRFQSFSYTLTETTRTALSAQGTPTASFAVPYSKASHLLLNASSTTWANWRPGEAQPTDTNDPCGQAAWSSMWDAAQLQNWTTGIYSTTASATPIPTSSLILPPPRYFEPTADCYSFPGDFMLGVAGAAAQVEGAIADEGRGPSLPDVFPAILPIEAELGSVAAGSTAFYGVGFDYVAIENYYLYMRDIDRLAAVGMKYYSFSVAWTRILPFALPGTPINAQGVAHYDDLINYVIKMGMQPIVTLHHYDSPLIFYGDNYTQSIRETPLYMANWDLAFQNDTFQDAFVNYGKIVMTHFADRVPVWFTFHEPQAGITGGVAADNVLKAHARLVHFYREELNGTGRCSLKMAAAPGVPQIPTNASHLEAVQHYNDLQLGTFLDTLILGLDYPAAFKMTIHDYVPLSAKDLDYLKGTVGKPSDDCRSVTMRH